MPHILKIKKVLEALGYKESDELLFTIKRFEKLRKTNVNVEVKDDNVLQEMFKMFAKRHNMTIINNEFPTLNGSMKLKDLINFLREYDEKFNINWCEIDFKEITIKPAYL